MRIASTMDKLTLEIEEKTTGIMWKNEFSASHLEAITQEAGSYRKFDVFIKLLISACEHQSGSVFIDIVE